MDFVNEETNTILSVVAHANESRFLCFKGQLRFENVKKVSVSLSLFDGEKKILQEYWLHGGDLHFVTFGFTLKQIVSKCSIILNDTIVFNLKKMNNDITFSLPDYDKLCYGTSFTCAECVELISLSQSLMLDWLGTADHIVAVTKSLSDSHVTRSQFFKSLYLFEQCT